MPAAGLPTASFGPSCSASTRAWRGSGTDLKHLPADPRCKLCAAPFAGPRRRGPQACRVRSPSRAIPRSATTASASSARQGRRARRSRCTLLFVDIRGSTALGERLTPTEFHDYLEEFYRIGSRAILDHDGLVDKLVGDEIIGLFFGGVSGPHHTRAGLAAAIELVSRAGRPDATAEGPIAVGAALHTGDAYVGPTGPANAVEDFTALGDVVNTTARLASVAAPASCSSAWRRRKQPAMSRPVPSDGRSTSGDARRQWTSSSSGRRPESRRRGPGEAE